MSIEIYPTAQVRLDPLLGKTIGILGYGNQGQAHALNLRDAGCEVIVGQRPGRRWDQATADGFTPVAVSEAAQRAELIVLSLPDEVAAEVYDKDLAPALRPGQSLGFLHGFNIRYGFINYPADVNVVMVAPKGPGTLLRSLFIEGKGLPALLAVEQDATGQAEALALAWAAGIGAGRAAVVRTTFATETETDLFGEQAVLCGGVTALAAAAFETLVQAGYAPEFAYLECVHELKQIVDLIYTEGIEGMRHRISNTAEYGDRSRGPRVIDEHVRANMRELLAEIQDGRFAREWLDMFRKEGYEFRRRMPAPSADDIELAGAVVRGLMPWLK